MFIKDAIKEFWRVLWKGPDQKKTDVNDHEFAPDIENLESESPLKADVAMASSNSVTIMSPQEFDSQELYRWITPGEFSFGPDGHYSGLQPVPAQCRQNSWSKEMADKSHECRVFLATTRKAAGMPPIYWNKLKNFHE